MLDPRCLHERKKMVMVHTHISLGKIIRYTTHTHTSYTPPFWKFLKKKFNTLKGLMSYMYAYIKSL